MLLQPTYFPSILQCALMVQTNKVLFEIQDNFQKQTYRNRAYILAANGKQLLNVPVKKISGKQLTKDIKIDYSSNWQLTHLKTLQSAYNSSPFFEYYIDDLMHLFQDKPIYLLGLNTSIYHFLADLLEINTNFLTTKTYQVTAINDYRFLVNSKGKTKFELPKYTQVFDAKFDFLSNLSILDLLFMEGPAATLYLEKIDLANVFKNSNLL